MLTQDVTMQYPADTLRARTTTRQRGTSLVEVLVVLVILVLGIFSIARLFPGGFFTIRSAENNTFADRLAQAQLETLKQNSAFLLDGVYVFNPTTNPYTADGTTNGLSGFLDPVVNLADLNNDYPSAASPAAAYGDINKARYVKGELFTVPTVSVSGPTAGLATHLLNYGPIVVPLTAVGAPDTSSLAFPSVTSAPWAAQTASSQANPGDLSVPVDNPNDLLQAGKPNFLIDYANGKIAMPPAPYDQNFEFQVQSSGATYLILLDVKAQNATNNPYGGGWFDPTTLYTGTITNTTTGAVVTTTPALPLPWTPGTASLKRPLQVLTTSITPAGPQADPYQCALAPSTAVSSGVNMGVLEIDPRLVGQQMSASYLVQDWHIIHEDVDVPAITTTFGTDTSVTNAPIRLTLNHLRRVGDVLSSDTTPGGAPTSSVYPGLFPGAANGYDIVLLDTDTGQMQGLAATSVGSNGTISDSDNDTTAPAPGQFAVSYQNGRITLPAQSTANTLPATQAWTMTSHKHLRVFYAGDYGWAVALQKNPALYTQNTSTTPGAVPGIQQFIRDPANPTHLIFPQSDLGQSVEVDRLNFTDANGNVQQVATVSGPIKTDFAGTNYVDLSPFLNNVNPTNPNITFGPVRGISARAVVIWKERDQWKTRTVGTILNRS